MYHIRIVCDACYMIDLNFIERMCCKMLSGLFEVTDTGCVLKNIKNGIKTVVKYNTFLLVKTYAFENLWKRKLRKNCFFSSRV